MFSLFLEFYSRIYAFAPFQGQSSCDWRTRHFLTKICDILMISEKRGIEKCRRDQKV